MLGTRQPGPLHRSLFPAIKPDLRSCPSRASSHQPAVTISKLEAGQRTPDLDIDRLLQQPAFSALQARARHLPWPDSHRVAQGGCRQAPDAATNIDLVPAPVYLGHRTNQPHLPAPDCAAVIARALNDPASRPMPTAFN